MSNETLSKEGLVADIRQWLKSDEGRDYACVKDLVPVSHDPTCIGCLLKFALRELEKTL